MSTLTLISHHLCPYVQRAVITLTEKSVGHERVYIDLAAKPEWFRALSPLGKVPLLEVGDIALFESAVICEFLEETTAHPLHPTDPLAKAQHRAWVEFASAILNDIAGLYTAKTATDFAGRAQTLTDRFTWLERHLGTGPYFTGDAFSMVDAAFAPVFRYFETFERHCDLYLFADLPKTSAWRTALAARPSVETAVDADYDSRLMTFLQARNSHISKSLDPSRQPPKSSPDQGGRLLKGTNA